MVSDVIELDGEGRAVEFGDHFERSYRVLRSSGVHEKARRFVKAEEDHTSSEHSQGLDHIYVSILSPYLIASRTMSPRVIRRYFHPRFCNETSQGVVEIGQELWGSTRRATAADRTAPKEKKMERAVTRYCFSLGMCSRRRVPSVGIEPC